MKKDKIFNKVTTDDIRAIKIGTSVTFTVEKARLLQSVRNRAYGLNSFEPELGKKFSCQVNIRKRQITITANPL